VVSQAYKISVGVKNLVEEALKKDSNATIQAIVSTTLGEIYKSNEYPMNKLLENMKYAT
jgi:hypothetical protein